MKAIGGAIFCVLAWALAWIALTWQPGPVPPPWSVAYRFTLAGLIVILWAGRAIRIRDAGVIATYAVPVGATYWLAYEAQALTSASIVATVFSLQAILTSILQRALNQRSLSPLDLLGCLIASLGVAIMLRADVADLSVSGVGLALLSALAFSVASIVAASGPAMRVDIATLNGWGMLGAGLLLAMAAAMTAGAPVVDLSTPYLASLAFLVLVASVAAFQAYLFVVREAGAGPASWSNICVPPVVVLIAFAIDDRLPSTAAVSGCALIVAGLGLAALALPKDHECLPL